MPRRLAADLLDVALQQQRAIGRRGAELGYEFELGGAIAALAGASRGMAREREAARAGRLLALGPSPTLR